MPEKGCITPQSSQAMASSARKPRLGSSKRPHVVTHKEAEEGLVEQAFVESKVLRIVAVTAVALLASYVGPAFFEPALDYRRSDAPAAIGSPAFQRTLES